MQISENMIYLLKNMKIYYRRERITDEESREKPSPATIMRLIAASGGHCQFEGCPYALFKDEIKWA